jgi:hypothetical protein
MNNDIHIYGNVLLSPIFTETRTSWNCVRKSVLSHIIH